MITYTIEVEDKPASGIKGRYLQLFFDWLESSPDSQSFFDARVNLPIHLLFAASVKMFTDARKKGGT